METCPHNILTGSGALEWALRNGFKPQSILTEEVKREWAIWKEQQVIENKEEVHDTIGLICLDEAGNLAAGTSTSG
jgi:N4-(beta-N-acetylglucosaminyl)-L-asparaginase